MSSLVKAVKSINPNAKFILVGDDLNNIEWIYYGMGMELWRWFN